MTIKVKYFSETMPRLNISKKGDWIDLRVSRISINDIPIPWSLDCNGLFYNPNDFLLIYLGMAMEFSSRFEAHVRPRGSTFKKYGLIQVNSVGVIDHTYCGDDDEWFVPMLAMRNGYIKRFDRIAQFRLVQRMDAHSLIEVDRLGNKNRGGHGSTGYE